MKHALLPLLALAFAAAPAWASDDLAKKNGCAADTLAAKVKAGGKGVWGQVPMPPQAKVADADLKAILGWALSQ